MKILRWFWLGFFILFFAIGTISCTSARKQIMGEPGEKEIAAGPVAEAPPEAASTPPEKTSPAEAAEMRKPEGYPPLPQPKPEGIPSSQISPPKLPPMIPPQPQQPLPASPAVPPVGAPDQGPRFVLNFDNADLYEVIRVMSEMMKINYIIDPRVKGVVNIHTSGQISTEEVFPIFQSILRLNGATAVQKGVVYEIVPFTEAKKLYTPPTMNKDSGKKLTDEKYTIQIIPLKYIPVTEVSKLVKPFLSDGADIVEHSPQNLLIIGDIASNIKKSLDIIALFDIDIFAEMRVRIYPILNADVNEIAKEMERIFSSFEVSTKSGRGVGITFTPITRINSLLVVSSIPQIFTRVEGWLKELDKTPAEGTKINVFVYYVQNGKAKDLAEVLKQIYIKGEKKQEFKENVITSSTPAPQGPSGVRPAPSIPSPPPYPAAAGAASAEAVTGGVPEGEINIVVDETNNALIIRAFQRDYMAILDTVKKLDVYPKQVLIEVLLAEVTLDDVYKYGLEFSTFTDSFTQGGRSYNYTVGGGGIAIDPTKFTSGLRYSVVEAAGKLTAAIHASATENRLKVISSPHILASNNKEAKIQIGSAQPILTNTYTTTGTSTPGVVEGTIEYKDIGIILTVTPRISDGKLVTLEISVEQSTVDTTTLGNLPSIPVFRKKTAKTTLSIMESQTIVIGGLIEDSRNLGSSGIPFLSKIPILGALFGYKTHDTAKTETVLLMTPHVVTDLEESNTVTQEFKEKLQTLKKDLEEKEKQKVNP